MFVGFPLEGIITFILVSNAMTIIDETLVVHFFQFKSIQNGYLFDCLSIIDKIQLMKHLMKNYIQISENDINPNITLINSQLNRHYGIIIDGDCINSGYVLKQAEKLMLFDDTQHWLVMASNNSILKMFANLALNINSNLYLALSNNTSGNNNKKWAIIDVYNPAYKHGGEIKTEIIGFYNKENGLKIKRSSNKYWNRRNMAGVTFKVMAVLRKAANMTLDEFLYCDNTRKIDSFVRFHCRLIHYCRDMYNFNMTIISTNSWGYEYDKGKFDGLTGALQNKEVDFGCAGLYIKPERLPILDFAVGLWIFRDIFVFRQPRNHSFGRLFVRPMSPSVWLSVLAAALLILFTLKITQKHEVNIVKASRDSLDKGWSTLILIILGAICQQGCHQYPSLLCGRIITISILGFCLLFYQFYSGTVVSFLLTKPPPIIKTPNDLVKNPIEVGSEDSPYIKDYFQTTKDPVAIELYRRKIMKPERHKPNYFSPECGLKLVEQGDFAYQIEINAGYTIISDTFSNRAICELGEVEMFPPKMLLTVLQKNSPFRDMLNYCMLRLDEQGISDREKIFWRAQKPECLESSNTIKIEVGLKEIYPAILLFFVGIVTSLIVLAFEMFSTTNVKQKIMRKVQTVQPKYPFYN